MYPLHIFEGSSCKCYMPPGGEVAIHFGQDNIIATVEGRFYWTKLKSDAACLVSRVSHLSEKNGRK